MTPRERWLAEVDTFIRQFAERAGRWDDHPGDLEAGEPLPPQPADGWDYITVLRARGRRLAKRISRARAIESYAAAKHFDLSAIPVDGLDHLEEDLRRLLNQPDRCIVRGKIADLGRTTGVRRLLHSDGDAPASLIEVPRRWLALDVDSIPLPDGVVAEDIPGCAAVAIAALPADFRGVRCIAQATASHALKPGIRLRLWYWLARPVHGAELKRWLLRSPVDHALFGAAQLIYTAAPIFDARRDPLPNRMVRLPGAAQVNVPDLPEPARPPDPKPVKPEIGLSRYAAGALDGAYRHITEAREGELDAAINRESYSIGRLAGADAVPTAYALKVLHAAASKIPGYSRRDAAKVDRSFNQGLRNPRGVPIHG